MRFSSVISVLTISSAAAFAPSSPLLASSRSLALFVTTAGKVKWFNPERRFGFIVQEDGTDLYVHDTGLTFEGALVDDELVGFDIEMDPKTNKNKAVNVVRIEGDVLAAVEEE